MFIFFFLQKKNPFFESDRYGRKMLNLSGERKEERTKEDKEKGSKSSSRMYGKFSRSLLLPDGACAEGVKARQENGILALTIPRTPAKPKAAVEDIPID